MFPGDGDIAETRILGQRDGTPRLAPFAVGDLLTGVKDVYRLERILGRGASGIVYEASRTSISDESSPRRRVAVKTFLLGRTPGDREFALREISSMRAITSDRIPQVLDWVVGDGYGILVIPYYERGSLLLRMANGHPLPEREGWRLLVDLLVATKAAHAASLLHLDIKPANVLLDYEDGFVLADFSLAQGDRVSPDHLAAGLGSPGYQAPEQQRREILKLDARTDLWGIGATVWAAVTGVRLGSQRRLRGANATESARLIDDTSSEFTPPPPFRAVLDKLLQSEPADRPGSAAEVLALIESISSGVALPGEALATARPADQDQAVVDELLRGLIDPLWQVVFRLDPRLSRQVAAYKAGEALTRRGDKSYYTYILLKGSIAVERNSQRISVESREGTLLGEVSTLSGGLRTADLVAVEDTWVAILNSSELEELITRHPSVGLRMLKTLAARLQQAITTP